MRTMHIPDLSKVLAVARREFVARTSTRTFAISTLLLVIAAGILGLAPVAVGWFDRDSSSVAVYAGAADLRGDPIATLDALLNPPPEANRGESDAAGNKMFAIRASTDLDADRSKVLTGELSALVDVERGTDGDTVFTVYTKEPGRDAQAQTVIRQAATSIAVADRLGRAGVTPADQARLFTPPQITVRSPDPTKPVVSPEATAQEIADVMVILGLEMFLLLAIILYGTWVAQSVVEEKSSRMMEIILASASPFQLLAGKVLGVSAAALLQFVAVLGVAVVALLAQGQVASVVLDEASAMSLPSGLTPPILLAFSVLFVLGFVLYAVLFAAAGSLVSRQEDVNQMIMPMTLLCSAGYMIAMYSSLGTLDSGAPWVLGLSWVPFLSPYMMLSRLAAGTAGPPEVVGAILLLVAAIVLAIWFAARIYSAGVLMYGQKPSIRTMWRAMREAG